MTWDRGASLKFDPTEFNVPPSIGKGTSQRLQCWIQSAHSRALDVVAHSGHFPFGKDTDVARWCVQHGLNYIMHLDKGITGLQSLMRQANIINVINQDTQRNLQFLNNIEMVQQNVLQLRSTGEPEMAKDLVMRIRKEILAMPNEPEREGRWKKKYYDRFELLFKDLIEYED